MTKLRRKTIAPKRKPSSKRPGGERQPAAVLQWFYRPVNLPYRPSREVEQTIEDVVERLT